VEVATESGGRSGAIRALDPAQFGNHRACHLALNAAKSFENRAFGSKRDMNSTGEEFLKILLREKRLLLFSAPVLYERQRW